MEDLAWQNSIPNTFGKESDKLGRPLSNSFGPGFLQKVAAGGKDGVGVVGKALLEDEEVKSFVRKYAGNSKVRKRGRGGEKESLFLSRGSVNSLGHVLAGIPYKSC